MYLEFNLRGEDLLLLPEKAIYWKRKSILLVADLHLGKITHFRKAGIPLPVEPEQKNWEILCTLIQEWNPKKLILLGDLFHSDYNSQWQNFCEITQIYNECEWILVRGNHDILSDAAYDLSNMTIIPSTLEMDPFLFSHEPIECNDDLYNLCGHIHPGIRLIGNARQTLRLPVYFFGEKYGILPAFGAFTGLHVLNPKENDQLYIIANNEVIDACPLIESKE